MMADELHRRHWIIAEARIFLSALLFNFFLNKNKQLSSEELLTFLVPPMSNVNIHQNMPRAKSESLHFAIMLRVLKEHTHITTHALV